MLPGSTFGCVAAWPGQIAPNLAVRQNTRRASRSKFSGGDMNTGTQGNKNKATILASLPMRADEDPYVVGIGGFYRRWFNLIDDMQLLIDTVAKIKSRTHEDFQKENCRQKTGKEKDAEEEVTAAVGQSKRHTRWCAVLMQGQFSICHDCHPAVDYQPYGCRRKIHSAGNQQPSSVNC